MHRSPAGARPSSPRVRFNSPTKCAGVQSTYYLPFESEIPKTGEPRDWIGYYQWVGLLLCVQAAMFHTPRIIWRVLNSKSGIRVSTITDAAIQCTFKNDVDEVDKIIRYMVKHMGRFLTETSRNLLMAGDCKSVFWIMYGNYLCGMYLVVKILYIVNSVGQILLLDRFIGSSYGLYGFEVIDKLSKGEGISQSHRFPRVTLCDIDIRHLGTVNRYTVQCALPANLFN